MISPNHLNETDRLAEVAREYKDVDVIINMQGDEPLIEPSIIDELADVFLTDDTLKMATVMTPMLDVNEQ